MKYEMRELKGDDLFTLLSIVGKLDIKDDFVKLFEQNREAEKNSKTIQPQDHKKKEPTKAELKKMEEEKAIREAEVEKRGMVAMANVLQTTLRNLSLVKDDINALLADLSGVEVSEIKKLGLKEYTTLLFQFFKKPELKDFFTSIASLL